MSRLLLVAFVLFGNIACADLADDVRCREIGFSISAENRDAVAFADFIDDDARFVGASALRGPAAITQAWQVYFADDGPSIKWRPQFVEVLEDGKLALTRGPYRLVIRDADGNETELWGTFNSVWRLQSDGEWKVVFDVGGNPTESPTDEVKALLEADSGCDL